MPTWLMRVAVSGHYPIRTIYGQASVLLGLLLGAGSCSYPLCIPGVEKDVTYTVRVLSPYNDQTPGFNPEWINTVDPPCMDLDGMTPGVSFRVSPYATVQRPSCDGLIATVMQVPGVTILGGPTGTDAKRLSGIFMEAGHDVATDSGCMGRWGTLFLAANDSISTDKSAPFSDPIPGEPPPLLLERWFIPSTGQPPQCQRCSNTFVIKLER